MGAFGEKLRKQREQRGLELDAISNTTKISTRMLRALEDEQFDQLPGGVFNKGFVRAYARQVGLDEEEIVADYLTALRESQIQQRSILPDFRASAGKLPPVANDPSRYNLRANTNDGGHDYNHELRTEGRNKQGRRNEDRRNEDRRNEDRRDQDLPHQNQSKDFSALPDFATHAPAANPPAQRFRQKYPAGNPGEPADQSSTPIPWGKLALALLLVTLVLAFWNFRRHAQPTPASNTVASSDQAPAPASGPAPTSAPASAATRPAGPATSPRVGPASPAGIPATSSAATTPHPNSEPPTLPASAAPAPAENPASLTASVAGSASKPAAQPPQPRAKPARATVHLAAPKPPPSFTVLIRAEETTWVSLMADGKPVAHETLIAPAHTSVRARHEIIVKTGNAAGISFLLNGKEIPAQGNEGEVKTYVFDAPGVPAVPPAQLPATNR
ncbi:MAG: RodZ domain-containing protein [Candidatus Sulfotelmatobacter sp.]